MRLPNLAAPRGASGSAAPSEFEFVDDAAAQRRGHSFASCGLADCQVPPLQARHVALLLTSAVASPRYHEDVTVAAAFVEFGDGARVNPLGCRRCTRMVVADDAAKLVYAAAKARGTGFATASSCGLRSAAPQSLLQLVRDRFSWNRAADADADPDLDRESELYSVTDDLAIVLGAAASSAAFTLPAFLAKGATRRRYMDFGTRVDRGGVLQRRELLVGNVRLRVHRHWYETGRGMISGELCLACRNVRATEACALCSVAAAPAAAPAPLVPLQVQAAGGPRPFAEHFSDTVQFGAHLKRMLDGMMRERGGAVCSICLDEVAPGDTVATPSCCPSIVCVHRKASSASCYAKFCDWIRQQGTCPNCRCPRVTSVFRSTVHFVRPLLSPPSATEAVSVAGRKRGREGDDGTSDGGASDSEASSEESASPPHPTET
jgi:hypothetical protein